MPIGPRTFVELADFRFFENFLQCAFTDGIDKNKHIVVVADVHHLCEQALGLRERFIWRFPPDVFFG